MSDSNAKDRMTLIREMLAEEAHLRARHPPPPGSQTAFFMDELRYLVSRVDQLEAALALVQRQPQEIRVGLNPAGELVMRTEDVALFQQLYTEMRHLTREGKAWQEHPWPGPEAVSARIRRIAELMGMPT